MNMPEHLKLLDQGDEFLIVFLHHDEEINSWATVVSNIYPDIITYNYIVGDEMYFGRARFQDYGKVWKAY